MMIRGIKYIAVAFQVLLVIGTVSYAQQDLGSITGTVRDPSGAVVPGAEVIAQRTETGVESKIPTRGDGSYTFPSLHIGTYALRVTATGFKTAEAKDLRVVAGETVTMDFALQLGQVAQVTTVTGAAPLVDTKTNTLGTTRTVEESKDLPLEMAA